MPANADHQYTGDNQIDAELQVKEWLAMGLTDAEQDAYTWTSDFASNFASVFGTTTTNAKGELMVPDGHGLALTENVEMHTDHGSYTSWAETSNFEDIEGIGALEYLELFGGNAIASPFQDGHYIYLVIQGNGSGSESVSPILFVADLESPKDFWKKLQP